jgi:DNA-binding NtrC family response regulator
LDPKEALQLVKNDPEGYDLMITDMVMPNLDGAQLARLVLKIQPRLPIILCSGHCNLSPVESNKIGIRKFMRKPVDLNDLEKEVRTALVGEADTNK